MCRKYKRSECVEYKRMIFFAVYMLMVMNVEEEEEKKAAGKSVDACFFRHLS